MALKELGKFALVAFEYLGFCLGFIAVTALIYNLIILLEKLIEYVRKELAESAVVALGLIVHLDYSLPILVSLLLDIIDFGRVFEKDAE